MKKRGTLTTKLFIIFGLTMFFSMLIFFLFFSGLVSQLKKNMNHAQQKQFLNGIVDDYPNLGDIQENDYNGYVIFDSSGKVIKLSRNFDNIIGKYYTIKELEDKFNPRIPGIDNISESAGTNNIYFMLERTQGYLILTFSNGTYKDYRINSFNTMVIISFIVIFVASNSILLIWTRKFIKRIALLQDQVSNLGNDNYEAPIKEIGNDEIAELAYTIEDMREQIYQNEKVKQEMLQNLSHDLKTPIAVIQSYAEAIGDGLADENASEVIIKQTELLTHKVTQMLHLNKIEYIKDEKYNEEIVLSDLIKVILKEYKYRINVEVVFDYDDSRYIGIKEDYYIAFQNILDNGLRYAESKIKITIKNQTISFYNDGEPLPQSIVETNKFKAYEKGERGQFGLGMIIVQKTVDKYSLKLIAENIDEGVMFTIMPR